MMKIKNPSLRLTLIAAFLAGAAGPATAASQTLQADLQYRLQLIDLDPNDGIAPGFTYFTPYHFWGNQLEQHSAAFTSGGLDYRKQFKSAYASTDQNGLALGGVTNQASYSAADRHTYSQALDKAGYAYGRIASTLQFGLTPNTRLEIIGSAALNGQLDGADAARAHGEFALSYFGYNDQSRERQQFVFNQEGGAMQQQRAFSMWIDNASVNNAGYYFYADSAVSLRNVAAVPEMESWGLMGAGLLTLFAMTRRRPQAPVPCL
ncbi:hypothetical protein V8J88_01690 [Massilia sp. W12]|uniref:hypothetical protein n=1 Tax=Massilia sp. W12 TaxID=3126507 RepID=UPI0030CBF9E6